MVGKKIPLFGLGRSLFFDDRHQQQLYPALVDGLAGNNRRRWTAARPLQKEDDDTRCASAIYKSQWPTMTPPTVLWCCASEWNAILNYSPVEPRPVFCDSTYRWRMN